MAKELPSSKDAWSKVFPKVVDRGKTSLRDTAKILRGEDKTLTRKR